MQQNLTRRNFLVTAGATALVSSLTYGAESPSTGEPVKILGTHVAEVALKLFKRA
jgi:hypothetical protein